VLRYDMKMLQQYNRQMIQKLNFELLPQPSQFERARPPTKESTVKVSSSRRVRNTAEHDSSVSSSVAVLMQQTGSH